MTDSLDVLLAGLVDYAGLFPPTSLTMSDAVRAYGMYRSGPRASMLGRFVVPAQRLQEFAEAAAPLLAPGDPWRLSVLAEPGDTARLDSFDAEHAGRAVIETIETKATTADAVSAAATLGAGRTTFVEFPLDADPAPFLAALARCGLSAKARTGGIVAGAIPSVEQVARFIGACARAQVPFKATAGLHHPMRGEYRLTYDENSDYGTMFGFLNVFAAAVFARSGATDAEIAAILDERAAAALQFTDGALHWRTWRASSADVGAARASFATSFGSCSFAEPVDDLMTLGLL
ncbi:MAG: hypothetical protein NTZ43_12580 [Gemmatimonadetes bacterium]|nr:hypothetical protein [Gemmatimonadota bacterium]